MNLSVDENVVEKIREVIKQHPYVLELLQKMEAHSFETYNHILHVTYHLVLFCETEKYSRFHTDEMILCALLHDAGKLHISNEILGKPAKLTEREKRIVHHHPYTSAIFAKKHGCAKNITAPIFYHHWRPNKKGYPWTKKLAGKAREQDIAMMQICDIYSAIMQPRAFRKAGTLEYAISEINNEWFDVKLKADFAKMIKERGVNDNDPLFVIIKKED